MIQTSQPLSRIALTYPAASRVFHRHGLDYCCGGARPLAEACRKAGLDADAIAREIEAEETHATDAVRWDERPLPELVDHILARYHAPLREELGRLLAMAEKVERVHHEKPHAPHGLAKHLRQVVDAVEDHLQKEEQILFPAIQAGHGQSLSMPVHVMEQEHDDHGASLRRTRALTRDLTPPQDACTTWRALYLGLEELERELMDHIHLENNVLFPRALAR
jgi:regulator of cell morphogenesis and NO signaling